MKTNAAFSNATHQGVGKEQMVMRNLTGVFTLLVFVSMPAGCAANSPILSQSSDGTVIRGKSFDGGDIIYDGNFYDYRDAEGRKGITLWIPPNVKYVRGVLFHGNPGAGGDTRAIPSDFAFQEFAARFDFAVAGVTWFPGRQVRTETGKVILKVFEDWAKIGKNPELVNVPFIAFGSSNAAATAYGLACVVPDRMICFTPNVGPSYGTIPPDDAVLKVPAWMHIGPADPIFKNGLKDTVELFRTINSKEPLWAWDAEQNKKHEIGLVDAVDWAYYELCINLRLPADADPRKGPVRLNPPRREEGWLADASTWESAKGATYIAPIKEYKGDPLKAVWLPNAEMALLYRAIATYNNPLKLRIANLQEITNPNASGLKLRSMGKHMVDPGAKLVLECVAAPNFEYEKIEFYQCGQKIGEVRRGIPIRWEASADGSHAANAFVAVATNKDGAVFSSCPVHVVVRDPKLAAGLQAQRKIWLDNIISAPKVAAGSSADLKKAYATVSSGDSVLVAYGLTAQQEEQFGKSDGISPFWADFSTEMNRAGVDPKLHSASQPRDGQPAGQQKIGNASMVVKAAHSRAGLYLLFEVSGGQPKPDEGVDFHIARDSSKEMWAGNPVASRISTINCALALSEMQYQTNFGVKGAVDTTIQLTYPCHFTMFAPRKLSDAETKEKYGIIVRRHWLADGRKAMEWFIPWAYVGKPGAMSEPAVGTRFGMVLGYNSDLNLRWPKGIDPWGQSMEQGQKNNCWGDLEIGPRFRSE